MIDINVRLYEVVYTGALMALRVKALDNARELASLTRNNADLAAAIEVMAAAREGDRVWPALDFLRRLRDVPAQVAAQIRATTDDDEPGITRPRVMDRP